MNFDTIYNDITTKVLPKLAEGLTITKDYFQDLSGRYIQYLILTDSIYLGINIILFILSIYYGIKLLKWAKKISEDNYSYNDGAQYLVLIIPTVISVISFTNIFIFTEDLTKDIFIPELRIYEEYKNFNN